jgi:phosphatidylethanolamine-binding protein (PEBP) family uncharacterized protein
VRLGLLVLLLVRSGLRSFVITISVHSVPVQVRHFLGKQTMYGAVDSEGGKAGEASQDVNTNSTKWRSGVVWGVVVGAALIVIGMVAGSQFSGPRSSLSTSKLSEESSSTSSSSTTISSALVLSSPAFADLDSLPLQYTCSADDGVGSSPPFEWTGAPEGTKSYALILHSEKHWDWGVFNIPATQTSVAEGCSSPNSKDYTSCGGFAAGSSPDRPMYFYTPPCSEGRGAKEYYCELYALSDIITPTTSSHSDDDGKLNLYDYAGFTVSDLLTQIEGITLASSSMTTTFTRWTRADDGPLDR